jgi:hypothetical protein
MIYKILTLKCTYYRELYSELCDLYDKYEIDGFILDTCRNSNNGIILYCNEDTFLFLKLKYNLIEYE